MAELPRNSVAWQALLRRLERRFPSRADAEDALQSAYLRLDEYRTRVTVENPLALLVRTAVNIGLDQGRRSRVRGEMDDRDAALAELIDEAPLQEQILVAREELARVQSALDRLPERTREIFLMSRIDELKYSEIGDRLGISVSAVEKHVAKAVLLVTRARKG